MALTRNQRTLVGIAVACLMGLLVYIALFKVPVVERPQTRQGPNPDGSWGDYAESMVQVRGITINREAKEITIYLLVDLDTGGKYTTHATLPLDSTIEED